MKREECNCQPFYSSKHKQRNMQFLKVRSHPWTPERGVDAKTTGETIVSYFQGSEK